METVRVNMTPNNEVKTIHCSQNDGNTRKWGFELYKEDGIIDGSSIKEQMLFNAYKGGTEQILPENTSTPTTSPIFADIQYKDALRSEQEFLYRESPATEDGQARITKIKGNTIKFNQLVKSTDTSIALQSGHKFYTVISGTKTIVSGTGQTISVTGGTDMVFDLTSMGIDNLTTTSEVEAWLSSHIGNLPYYDYTTGKLLPFMGTGLKTTGKHGTELGTLSLPISTYFPTGMKRAGSVYDELTENKASVRIGSVDLGSLTWVATPSYSGSNYIMYSDDIKDFVKKPSGNGKKANIVCGRYETKTANDVYTENIGIGVLTSGRLFVYDTNYNTSSSASSFKTAMSDVYLYYELNSYSETDITTASLVTEKGEASLYYDDDILKADCLTALSSEAGIFDAKIKLMDDETVYSQKIQLHVERKP